MEVTWRMEHLRYFFSREWSMRCEKLLHVIAISQAGIAAPTVTLMQGFKAKKIVPCISYSNPLSLLHNLPFHTFAPQTRIEPGCDGWKPTTVTTTLRSLHQHNEKMSYLNQMYKKGNGSIREEKEILRMFHLPSYFEIFLLNFCFTPPQSTFPWQHDKN